MTNQDEHGENDFLVLLREVVGVPEIELCNGPREMGVSSLVLFAIRELCRREMGLEIPWEALAEPDVTFGEIWNRRRVATIMSERGLP